jgi:hypothetical protein
MHHLRLLLLVHLLCRYLALLVLLEPLKVLALVFRSSQVDQIAPLEVLLDHMRNHHV